jgi:hypothetical protein
MSLALVAGPDGLELHAYYAQVQHHLSCWSDMIQTALFVIALPKFQRGATLFPEAVAVIQVARDEQFIEQMRLCCQLYHHLYLVPNS